MAEIECSLGQPNWIKWGNRFAKPFAILAMVFVVLGVGFAMGRACRDYAVHDDEFDWQARGFSDLHTCYVYAKTFRHGLSPYENQDDPEFKTTRPSAPFSPVIFFILWPLSYLPLTIAEVVFSVFNVAMLGLLGYWVVRFSNARFQWHWWLATLGFLIFSRPGHITLYTGYFTPILVVGTLIALQYGRTRPWLAGVGVLLASAKPTYILPLLILLLCRKNFKAVIWGAALAGSAALAGLVWLAADSSIPEVIDSILAGQAAFGDDPTEFPINTWTRIDIVGMLAKAIDWIPDNKIYLACMMVLLVPPGWVIWRMADRETNHGAMGLSAAIAMLALLVTIYHHSYDCLLVTPVAMSLLLFGRKTMGGVPATARSVVVALLLVPAVNYFSTLSFREALGLDPYGVVWQSITMVNGFCLTASLLILMYYGWAGCRFGRDLDALTIGDATSDKFTARA
jgi:hypothetical protein